MIETTFLKELQSSIAATDLPRVIAALRQDSVIWKSLQDPEFFQKALLKNANQPENWSPANLALLALDIPAAEQGQPSDSLKADLQFPLDTSIRRRAARAYELSANGHNASFNEEGLMAPNVRLVQAGLLALALRERRRLVGSWSGLVEELEGTSPSVNLSSDSGKIEDITFLQKYGTVLACLYGLVPDPLEMLSSLLQPKPTRRQISLVLHILLSNPLTEDQLTEKLSALLNKLSLPDFISLLNQLSEQRPEIARWLAQERLSLESVRDNPQPAIPGLEDSIGYLRHLKTLVLQAKIYQQADKNSIALPFLNAAWESTYRLQAEIASQMAINAVERGDTENQILALKQAVELAPGNPVYQAQLIQAYMNAGRNEDAAGCLASVSNLADEDYLPHPMILLASACLALETGESEKASQTAARLVELYKKAEPLQKELILSQASMPKLASLLLELNMPVQAVETAQAALIRQPSQVELLELLAHACEAAGKMNEAVQALQLATSLSPKRIDFRRHLATDLESLEEWNDALEEWTIVIQEQQGTQVCTDDLHSQSRSAIRAGKPQIAAESSQQVLSADPEDGYGHALLGEALSQLGDPLTAQEHLVKATQLVPGLAAPWLSLVQLQKASNQPAAALDTLRAAAQAAPCAADVFLALGEAYLEDWEGRGHSSPTQALAMLQQAAKLASQDPGQMRFSIPIALRLGQALHILGHLNEARHALETAYQEKPTYPGLAFAYAQTLLALGEACISLPVLSKILELNPADSAPYLEYARAILEVGQSPEKALLPLRTLLSREPAHAVAKALLADALYACGDYQEALQAYRATLETELVHEPTWNTRLNLGLGRVALALEQPDTAIAALQEAIQADPNSSTALQYLAEAYQAAGLYQNAIETARLALRTAPEDLNTLTWFAEKVFELLEEGTQTADNGFVSNAYQTRLEALNAFIRAIQIAPQRTDLLVRLGKIQLQADEPEAALDTFRRIGSAENASPEDLNQSARYLLDLKDAPSAVACLERALHLSKGQAFDASGPGSLAYTLISAYQQAGNPQAALATLEQALSYTPGDITLLETKANLLLVSSQPQEAISSIEEAIQLDPDSSQAAHFHYLSALIFKKLGDLPAAQMHLEPILKASTLAPMDIRHFSARILSAELFRLLLQPDRAHAILGVLPENTAQTVSDPAILQQLYCYDCFQAELALDNGGDIEAAESASLARRLVEQNNTIREARLMAIQSRLNTRSGNYPAALQLLQEGLTRLQEETDQLNSYTNAGIETLSLEMEIIDDSYSLAQAALELGQWDTTIFLLRQAIQAAPKEALLHLSLARSIVLRAENQRLLEELDVLKHAPGQSALADYAHDTFIQAIENAAACQPQAPGVQTIARWRARGLAVFQPSLKAAQALASLAIFPLNPEDVAAHIAVLRQVEPEEPEIPEQDSASYIPRPLSPMAMAIQSARTYPIHPLVLTQLAMVLMKDEEQRKDAQMAAQEALKHLASLSQGDHMYEPLYSIHQQATAIGHALLARIAIVNHELEVAHGAIQNAIAIWPDEPRWQSLAANIELEAGDILATINHLEQAVGLEPGYIPHYLALGEAYLLQAKEDASLLNHAIHIFEKASSLSPEEVEPWIALSRAFRQSGDLNQAAACIEKAICLAPDQARPLVLRAEIAILAGNYQEAYERLLSAAQITETGNIKKAQDMPSPVLLLVRTLEGLDRNAEALALLEKAIPEAEDALPLLLERIPLLHCTQGSEAATEALQDLALHYPDEPLVLFQLANSLLEALQNEAAIRTAQRALQAAAARANSYEQKMNLSNAQRAQMHLLLGKLLRQSGQLDQSLFHLNEAIQLDPALLETYLELGRVHQERRQHNLALQVYNRATLVAPRDPRPYFQAGLALKESKDYVGAESMLRRAAALAPNDLNIHRQLGAVVALNLVHNRRRTSASIEEV